MTLISRVIKTEEVDWREFQYIQQVDFKEWAVEAKTRLKASILGNHFTQPFYIWQDDTSIRWCLDGRHRTLALEELIKEGYEIPYLLPTTFIRCENKKEAARLVLIYSSIYAKITNQGLFDFIQAYDLKYDALKTEIDLPEFSTDRFEQKFDVFNINDAEEPEEALPTNALVQPGDLFEINGHRILCGSFQNIDEVKELMNGNKARIVNCDPPYNLPTAFFEKKIRHDDFAMAAGEMTDDQFIDFLASIMSTSLQYTVEGGFHFIFMDWRHIWHMTEAARKVYGSPQPKQVCIWSKDIIGNGSFYRSQHELCFVFNNDQAKALWHKDLVDHGGFYKEENELCFIFKAGNDDVKHLSHLDLKDRIRSNIWKYPSAGSTANPDRLALKDHPTPKPVAMISDAILDTTNPGDIVIDWFLGSGTTLLAAEHTGRLCYATELEPKYVQAAIQRYINYCSKNGKQVNFKHLMGKLTIGSFNNERHTGKIEINE